MSSTDQGPGHDTGGPSVDRRSDLRDRLARVHDRIAAACAAAGRDPGAVTLIVVTKTFPAEDVRLLAGLGVGDVGENRDQDARGKHQQCADLALRWHFVGQLQRNKAASVASYTDVVHSLDRVELTTALDRAAERANRRLDVCVQVDLGPSQASDESAGMGRRGGVRPEQVLELADQVAASGQLRLAGVMAVAPWPADPTRTPIEAARVAFDLLAQVSAAVRASHPQATMISAGMSGDLEAAIAAGATHVRVGTAVLGPRPPLR